MQKCHLVLCFTNVKDVYKAHILLFLLFSYPKNVLECKCMSLQIGIIVIFG